MRDTSALTVAKLWYVLTWYIFVRQYIIFALFNRVRFIGSELVHESNLQRSLRFEQRTSVCKHDNAYYHVMSRRRRRVIIFMLILRTSKARARLVGSPTMR